MSGRLVSVNVGRAEPNRHKATGRTGINKLPVDVPVEVRAPGPKRGGLGSGLVGDEVLDRRHHGGDEQAVYAVAREELDWWADQLGRNLRDGMFGENLTTAGVAVDDAELGELWQVGEPGEGPLLRVTCPRIPCATFRGFLGIPGWIKTFTAHARSGAYLAVERPGTVQRGDSVTVVHRPGHGVSVSETFRALTLERELLSGLLRAGADLSEGLTDRARRG